MRAHRLEPIWGKCSRRIDLAARLSVQSAGVRCHPYAARPTLTVQTILGHKHVDTTLGYARLYDGTVAADYYRAIAQVEQRFASQDATPTVVPSVGEFLALVDALHNGTLSES